MSNFESITWPREFMELKRLDNLLRCGICYDYMRTCMTTSCSHSYCSLCIRKSMQYKTQCPTCFEETHEVNLRNNRTLDEIISLFTGIRDRLLRHLRLSSVHMKPENDTISPISALTCKEANVLNSSPRQLTTPVAKARAKDSNNFPHVSRRLDVSSTVFAADDDDDSGVAHLRQSPFQTSTLAAPTKDKVGTLVKIPTMFHSPKKGSPRVKWEQDIKTVPCPICNVDISMPNINTHLDKCLAQIDAPILKSPVKQKKRAPLPKRVYTLMSDKDLKKYLKLHELNTLGDRKSLIGRLQRFTVLYNSECDSENPRPISEIIRQMEKEESEEKRSSSSAFSQLKISVNRYAEPKVIEEEQRKYREANRSNFESLLNSMRERDGKNIKPTKVLNRVYSDDEDLFKEDCENIDLSDSSLNKAPMLDTSDDKPLGLFLQDSTHHIAGPPSPILSKSTVSARKRKSPLEYKRVVSSKLFDAGGSRDLHEEKEPKVNLMAPPILTDMTLDGFNQTPVKEENGEEEEAGDSPSILEGYLNIPETSSVQENIVPNKERICQLQSEESSEEMFIMERQPKRRSRDNCVENYRVLRKRNKK